MSTIIPRGHSTDRKRRKKIERLLKNKCLIQQNIWLLVVLAKFLSLLTLIFNCYQQRL